MSRIYKVKTPTGTRLVEAGTKGQAIKHCVSADYDAEVCSGSDVYAAMQQGIPVEKVGGETGNVESSSPSPQAAPAPAPTPASDTTAYQNAPQPAQSFAAPVQSQPYNHGHLGQPVIPVNPVLAEQQAVNPQATAAAFGTFSPPPQAGGGHLNPLPPEPPRPASGPVDWEARERAS